MGESTRLMLPSAWRRLGRRGGESWFLFLHFLFLPLVWGPEGEGEERREEDGEIGRVLVALFFLEGFWRARKKMKKGSSFLKRGIGEDERGGRGWGEGVTLVEGRQGWSTVRKLLRFPPPVLVVWEREAPIPFLLRLRSSANRQDATLSKGSLERGGGMTCRRGKLNANVQAPS